MIDQDAVFVSGETYGEVIKTRVFEDFCTEQEAGDWIEIMERLRKKWDCSVS